MKVYDDDSPEALSRILALTMVVDGHVAPAEVRAMYQAPFLARVGVDADTFDATMRELCEDLLLSADNRNGSFIEIGPEQVEAMLAEIGAGDLRMNLLRTMIDIVYADGHVDERETILVQSAARAWFGRPLPLAEALAAAEG
ncbi:Tellurite resistance protein TerB [Pseudoduganella namucuonensis]|uniref:Tellurite resistance protein TerB n=2 Tax=Pseudoduganella namucuonensis TaxID=1035707 RepID=A0A1I7M7Z8_9BURK|nr:Tellurite resistance protein TerB [Pseudoduganella namucuonensis]